jgi:thiol-disulfide isomerase/thioredoxin
MKRSRDLLFAVLVALLLSGCGEGARTVCPVRPDSDESPPAVASSHQSSQEVKPSEATVVKEIDLVESDWVGLQSLIEQQKGKLVVVDIWSTACEPCMHEFPHLIELQERFPNDVIAISFDVDYAGIKKKPPVFYRERVLQFLSSQPDNHVLHRMCTTAADDLFNDIKLDTIPAVYVYGRDGSLLKRFDGEGMSYEKQVIPFVGDQVKTATK